jgi:hypothetical protein
MANPAIVPALIKGGAAIAGGAIASRGASKAASAQQQAEQQRLDLERRMYEEDVARQEPFRQIGLENLNRLAALYSPETGAYFKAPTMNELLMDPGYQFRLSEGEKAMARMQAARGQYLGGGAIKAGLRYGQEMGSQEFQNAYARAMEQRRMATSALAQLGGLGPTATSEMGRAGQQYAAGAGQAISSGGQARASGYLGQSNALREALGGAVGAYGAYRGSGLSRQSLDEVLPEYKVTSRRY